ncbi:MAG TPA: glycosyl hydrolase family 8 [Stellaceae bacterium]|nr:glycosyl hydrolase family 8 [Stellaceae bacterium]
MVRAVAFAVLWVIAAVIGAATARADAVQDGWNTFRDRFVTADGRVLDTGNKEVSHTEGQGWAMLFAEAANDRGTFAKIWDWTHNKLQRHDNALFSWRWDPDGKTPVADPNDASDGDILIAWALARAAHHWKDPEYGRAAHRIVGDIRRRLLVTAPGGLVLLPGADGFKGDGVTVINPSYYIFPALKEFARVLPSPEWQRLRRDGLNLLADARFGRWGLTPDWIEIAKSGDLSPAAKFPPRFGFEAIRVPLYLIWAGEATPERLASYLDFWNDFGGKPAPAWVNVDDNSLAPYAGSSGFQAVVQLTRGFGQTDQPALPTINDKDDYYAASLTLLAAVAQRETAR